ncbi:hypothetical protein NQ318_023585 [Aromia moschata]|uniref:Endonuclease/exonuclease/phosphatase domain-containing protein n=1 Tax=Aromia moschata TaxID=1265417 RepID=A0AAV8YPM1_9CUCU|nr:hypothetical protein NQ318_023585 [Aromia moschata]
MDDKIKFFERYLLPYSIKLKSLFRFIDEEGVNLPIILCGDFNLDFRTDEGIVLKSAPCLTLDDRKDFAKLALDDILTFFNSMDMHNDSNENSDNDAISGKHAMQIMNTQQSNAPFSKMSSPPEIKNILEEEDQKHSLAVAEMSQEFRRIENIASSCDSVDMTNTVLKLTKDLKNVDTPAQLLNFFHSLPLRRGTKIGVQPTSMSRRKLRPGLTSGAIKGCKPEDLQNKKFRGSVGKMTDGICQEYTKRKTTRGRWSQETLVTAIHNVLEKNISCNEAASRNLAIGDLALPNFN